MVRPHAVMTSGVAWDARSVLVLPGSPSATSKAASATPSPTGDPSTPHGATRPTVGGGSATTGATGFEAASASPAPTPPKGAEPSAAGSPTPAVLAHETEAVRT